MVLFTQVIIKSIKQLKIRDTLLYLQNFKNYIMNTREGITVPNSVYIRDKEIARNFVLSRFLSNVRSGKITVKELDEETLENFKLITDLLKGLK